MSANVIMVLIGWLIALAIFFGFIVLLRYIEHRERMALITQGINPHSIRKQRRSRGILRAGLITMMVGLTLTFGLYPLGFLLPPAFTAAPLHLGPWLLPGLIPFGVGAALTISYYLEQNVQPPNEDKDAEGNEKVIPIQDHLDNDRRELP
ncbi:MAG: hypothetical protein JOZ18_03575 [Chloroflexi bacterium]|nr:hypothetical protein [Chloroflexota bacterium]